jgi:ubiquinone/menaquinone biosynthesis C-methylase UbiE
MKTRRVLFLSAYPLDQVRLRLDKELREIRNVLSTTKHGKSIDIQNRGAVQPKDLQQHLIEVDPQIIHFSGHSSADGLFLENENGISTLMSLSALTLLLSAWVSRDDNQIKKFEVVFLNSCFSKATAKAICPYADYVISMPSRLDDEFAIEFAKSFYRCLGSGYSVPICFQIACSAMGNNLNDLAKKSQPILIHNGKNLSAQLPESDPFFVKIDPMRAQYLWRLAYAFLLMDQLSSGGWGKTLNSWMESIWEGDKDSIFRNPDMRRKGGTDLTAYTYYFYNLVLAKLSSPAIRVRLLQQNGVADCVYDNMINKIGYKGGIGTRDLPRGGTLPDVRIRHSIMGAITLFTYYEAKKFQGNLKDDLTKICLYLEENLPNWRLDQTHLFAMVAVAIKFYDLLGKNLANQIDSPHLLNTLRSLLALYIPEMVSEVNKPTSYIPKPEGTINSPLRCLTFVPYYSFWRMERSNFLMYFPFLITDDGKAFLPFVSDEFITHCAQIFCDFLEDIKVSDKKNESQYQLVSYYKTFITSDSTEDKAPGDWGLSAELAALLNLEVVEKIIIEQGVIDEGLFRRKKRLLFKSLLQSFDRYHNNPYIFKYTHGSSFGRILSLYNNQDIDYKELERIDKVITKMRTEGITEKDLMELVKGQLNQESAELNQIDLRSIEDLLLDKLESGEYTPDGINCDVEKWQKRINFLAKQTTIDFYNSGLADLHIERYSTDPDYSLVSGIMSHFPVVPADCKALDVGCGTGQYAELLKKQGFTVFLLDASEKMLRLACERLNIPNESCRATNIFDTSWRYPDNYFDLIFACAILVHVPKYEIAEIYSKFRRLLKPNGLLFVNFKIGDHSLISEDGRFFEYYRDISFPQESLVKAGFTIQEVLMQTNYKNMYQDPKQIKWVNFYCTKTNFDLKPSI